MNYHLHERKPRAASAVVLLLVRVKLPAVVLRVKRLVLAIRHQSAFRV
jgi:hypothetical protein